MVSILAKWIVPRFAKRGGQEILPNILPQICPELDHKLKLIYMRYRPYKTNGLGAALGAAIRTHSNYSILTQIDQKSLDKWDLTSPSHQATLTYILMPYIVVEYYTALTIIKHWDKFQKIPGLDMAAINKLFVRMMGVRMRSTPYFGLMILPDPTTYKMVDYANMTAEDFAKKVLQLMKSRIKT